MPMVSHFSDRRECTSYEETVQPSSLPPLRGHSPTFPLLFPLIATLSLSLLSRFNLIYRSRFFRLARNDETSFYCIVVESSVMFHNYRISSYFCLNLHPCFAFLSVEHES